LVNFTERAANHKTKSPWFGAGWTDRRKMNYRIKNAVAREAFVTRYSGATVRDLHPLPYSPQTVV